MHSRSSGSASASLPCICSTLATLFKQVARSPANLLRALLSTVSDDSLPLAGTTKSVLAAVRAVDDDALSAIAPRLLLPSPSDAVAAAMDALCSRRTIARAV